MCLRLFKSKRGMSLVSTLVAVAVGSIFMVVMATYFTDTFKFQKRVQFKNEVEAFSEEIRSILSSEEACRNTFFNLPLNTSMNHNIENIKDTNAAPNPIRYDKTTVYGDNSIVISDMKFTNYRSSTGRSGDATFLVNFQQSDVPSRVLQRAIEIRTEHNGSDLLETCIATSKMTDGIWQRSTTNINNIFYTAPATGGNVGIAGEPLATVPGDPGRGGLFVFNHPDRGYGAIFSSWFTLGGNRTLDGSTGFNMYTESGGTQASAQIYRQTGTNGDIILHNLRGNGGLRVFTATQPNAFTVSDSGRVSVGVQHNSGLPETNDVAGLTVKSHPQRGFGGYFSSWVNLGDAREADGSAGFNLTTDSGPTASAQIYRQTGTNGDIILHNVRGSGGVRLGTASSMSTLFVSNNGNVGIGNLSPSHKLHVQGEVRANSSASAVSSDKRVKEKISDIDNALEKILQLRPVSFYYTKNFLKDKLGLDKEQYGFIAQEVKKVFPSAVTSVEETVGNKKIKNFQLLNLSFLNAYLVSAIQTIADYLEDIFQKVENITDSQSKLQKQIHIMEKKLKEMEQMKQEIKLLQKMCKTHGK